MEINAYLKKNGPWSNEVRYILAKYNLNFIEVDVTAAREAFEEMVLVTKQHMTPCVEINGVMLIDVNGEEVENYLISHQLVNVSLLQKESIKDIVTTEEYSNENSATERFF